MRSIVGLFVVVGLCGPFASRSLAAPPTVLDDLVRSDRATLESLYSGGTVTTPPPGFAPGRAIPNPGSRNTVRLANNRLTVEGESVQRRANDQPAGWRPRAVTAASTWARAGSTVSRQSSWITRGHKRFGDVRDEMREVSPGVYLGVMYVRKCPEPKLAMFFALTRTRDAAGNELWRRKPRKKRPAKTKPVAKPKGGADASAELAERGFYRTSTTGRPTATSPALDARVRLWSITRAACGTTAGEVGGIAAGGRGGAQEARVEGGVRPDAEVGGWLPSAPPGLSRQADRREAVHPRLRLKCVLVPAGAKPVFVLTLFWPDDTRPCEVRFELVKAKWPVTNCERT